MKSAPARRTLAALKYKARLNARGDRTGKAALGPVVVYYYPRCKRWACFVYRIGVVPASQAARALASAR